MNNKILFILFVSLILIFGCTQTQNSNTGGTSSLNQDLQPPVVETQTDIIQSSGTEELPDEEVEKSFYKAFNKAEFEEAKAKGKIIFLEFHANWCPVCRVQEIDLEKAFSNPALPDGIAGFRVNYRDDETNFEDEELAREFGISYQYSKIILSPSGEVLLKEVATPWDEAQIIEKLSMHAS